MAEIEVRVARPEDREAVLAFCTQTWDWGDYIDRVWDRWLTDPQGSLFVATSAGHPVGVMHLRMLNATDAWLEGIRVDPTDRQHGVGSALHEAALSEAILRGATNARLITEIINTAAIQLIQKSHMREVGNFIAYTTEATAAAAKRNEQLIEPVLGTSDDLEEVIEFLNVSNIFPLTGGLCYEHWTAYRLSDTFLREKIAARQLYLLRRWERLDGLALIDAREGPESDTLFIGYIDGTTESISLLAYALRRLAASRGQQHVRAHIPDMLLVRDAFSGAEYAPEGNVYLTFERSLE